jgi:hypothetical protein
MLHFPTDKNTKALPDEESFFHLEDNRGIPIRTS